MEGLNRKESNENKEEKPEFLYHASRNTGLDFLSPRSEKIRGNDEGDVVFASPDIALASSFLFDWDDSWVSLGKINGRPYILISDKQRFLENDKGGSIYKLSSNGFEHDLDKGMGSDEWITKGEVKPLEEFKEGSALNSMINSGLNVYFVDKKIFDQFKSLINQDKNLEASRLLDSLDPETLNI